jgi:hypothetical protein
VDFIDDKNLKATARREIFYILSELANIFDTSIGGPVDLDNIHGIPGGYFKAGWTDIAWLLYRSIFTLESLGKNAGSTGLPNASCAGKKKGMGNPAGLDCILQRPADMLLTDKVLERLWPPFSR